MNDENSRPTIDEPTSADGAGPMPAPLEPQRIAPHFPQLEILDIVGRGGMGVVYRARQTALDRVVALKILPPGAAADERFAERFAREARALARLSHPNIVMVHDSGCADGLYYFLMEYVDGMNLRGLMARGLEPADALALVPQICDAMQYAHDEGVMHRDIKPENILIDRRGRVKIADFGLAKLFTGPQTDYTLTAPQQVMGTMHYMAPEQVERPSEVDHRADVYALGVVLYEMLAGELPIGRFPLPSERAGIDPRLDEVVLRALEKEPARRYQSASDIGTAVQQLSKPPAAGAMPAFADLPEDSGVERRTSHTLTPRAPSSAPHVAGAPSDPQISFAAPRKERHIALAYLCWFACGFGLCGVHRMYAGKWVTGLLWLFTGGLFFIGQVVDLLLIPGMIRLANTEAALIASLQMQDQQQGS